MSRLLVIVFLLMANSGIAQALLQADGPGNTYELINSVFAPGYNVTEVPDCNHSSFGRHIDEVYDSVLNAYVFRFHIHTSPDNDRCIKFDRQRNEIKTYDKSPDSLLAVVGETVLYSWKFKLDSTFQPSSSFTHLHQIKAVGGAESSMPQITLTARKASPNRIELRYARDFSQVTLTQIPIEPFLGTWVEAREIITYGEQELGEYELLLTNLQTGDTLLYYDDDDIRMWKTNADFQRPKWGIYRSLNDSSSLKDEQVLFADLLIEELDFVSTSTEEFLPQLSAGSVYPNPAKEYLFLDNSILIRFDKYRILDVQGRMVAEGLLQGDRIHLSSLPSGLYIVQFEGDDTLSRGLPIRIN